jgi:hypothetical protein
VSKKLFTTQATDPNRFRRLLSTVKFVEVIWEFVLQSYSRSAVFGEQVTATWHLWILCSRRISQAPELDKLLGTRHYISGGVGARVYCLLQSFYQNRKETILGPCLLRLVVRSLIVCPRFSIFFFAFRLQF